jgi:tetratricopeptide (TPR) repeat protein
MRALGRTDKKATQFLAGGFELISRYETAPAAPRALIDVAIDASRFGFGANVPIALLREAAPDYIDDADWNERDDSWLERALSYASQPSLGIAGPLSKTRRRSDETQPQDAYRLADFLEEYGRLSRQYVLPPESFWSAVVDHASARALLDLAYQLEFRGRFKASARIYLKAAEKGDSNGWLFLADNLRRRGDNAGAEAVLRVAADSGVIDAQVDIAEILYEHGDTAGAKATLKSILTDKYQEFDSRSIAWDLLARVCEETGDLITARRLLRHAAAAGESIAIQKLAPNELRTDGAVVRELKKSAFEVRQSRRKLERARKTLVRLSARSDESFEWALQHYGAELAEEERNGDNADSLMILGRIHSARGDHAAARTMFLKAINVLDDPYEYGVIPALVELMKILKKKGDKATAERLWKYGLELDGSICRPWKVADQMPPAGRGEGQYSRANSGADGEFPRKYAGPTHGGAGSRGFAPAVTLPWAGLDDDAFERVLYNVLRDIPGYENVQWLMHTRAPDRGRDLSLDRLLPDAAGAIRHERVVVQAKHWLSRSLRPADIADTLAAVKLWEPPTIRCLVIATSGRFTADAVMWIERHNDGAIAPLIEPWPAPKLEALIAERPELARAHGLGV